MDEQEQRIRNIVEQFAKKLPKLSDGRIDYSDSDAAPVITVFIRFRDRILLLKRSDKVATYRGKWNTVSGYLDEPRPIREKVLEEIQEEVGIGEDNILSIHIGETYEVKDTEINKTWIVHPVLAQLKSRPAIRLDWEHTEYKWVRAEELRNFETVLKLEKSLEEAKGL